MRQWIDSNNRLMTDEQLLRHIAHFGSLDKALKHGDISIISETSTDKTKSSDASFNHDKEKNVRALADYLKEA